MTARSAMAAAVLCLALTAGSAARAGVTSLRIESDPASDSVLQRQFVFFTPDDGALVVSPYSLLPTTRHHVALVQEAPGPFIQLDFTAPPGEILDVGVYEVDGTDATAQLQPGYGCSYSPGRFEVKQIAFSADDHLEKFWATFEADCEYTVRGEVRYDADVPILLQAPSHKTAFTNRPMSFGIEGFDASGRPVTLTASNLPQGAEFTDDGAGHGHVAWTPAAEQEGLSDWSAFVGADGGGETDTTYTRFETFPWLDDFDQAIPFTNLPFSSLIGETEASPADDDPFCVSRLLPGGTDWYSYTAAENGWVSVRASFPFPAPGPSRMRTVSVYAGARGRLARIACAYAGVRFQAAAGTTYHIMVGNLDTGEALSFSASRLPPPPPNDARSQATLVGTLPWSDTVNVYNTFRETGDPGNCGTTPTSPLPGFSPSTPANVWYVYTPEQDTRLTVDTTQSLFPFTITAFREASGALVPLACDDGRLRFVAPAGQRIYLMIEPPGPIGIIGPRPGPGYVPAIDLRAAFSGKPALHIGVAIDPAATFEAGAPLVRGTATCSRPAHVQIHGQVAGSRRAAGAEFTAIVLCDGDTPWSAPIVPAGGQSVVRGPAAFAYDVVGVAEDDSETVRSSGRARVVVKPPPATRSR